MLSTRRALDRETRALYTIPVLARDGGGRVGYSSVRVNVADQADHKPQFKIGEYKANVYAYADSGTPVLEVGTARPA